MDTRNLSDITYNAIIKEAEQAHPDLALQFGLLAKISADESDFLDKSLRLTELMAGYSEDEADAIFLEDPLSITAFHEAITKINSNIRRILVE
jgi:hypothetical protein